MDKNTFRNPHVIYSNLAAGLSWVLHPQIAPADCFAKCCISHCLPLLFYPKKGFFQLLPFSCKDNLLVWRGRTPLSEGLYRERTDCISHRYFPLKGQLYLPSCSVRKASLPLRNIQTCSVPRKNRLGNVKLFKRTRIMFSKILIKISYHS